MGQFAYVNGSIVDTSQAQVSIGDRGLMYGDGLFETVRVRGGEPVRWERHLRRMRGGARILSINGIAKDFDPAPIIRQVCEANELADARVRVTITRGVNETPGRITGPGDSPTVIITADSLPVQDPAPARVVTSSMRRDEKSPLNRVKSLNYLTNIFARMEAERCGVDDAILLNTLGFVAEGTVANLFMVSRDMLVTPSLDQGILPGTVREELIELAPGWGYGVEERPILPEELLDADELFFTNAIALIRPITEMDGIPIGRESFDVSNRLLAALKELEPA